MNEARHRSGPIRVTYNPFGMDTDCSIRDPFVPANEFLRVSMLFPSCLDVSVLVFDNILNLFESLGSQILRFTTPF